ncbi:MAG TPA: DnaA N-terminal domain-containing protein [Bryobacteraceae bacterium]|nr:DnaA N-terminal domain-containing protein [Bryobacteraceae bacterium]
MADRREPWRFWKYLDEQVQLAVERCSASPPRRAPASFASDTPRPVEDPDSEWARVKSQLKGRLHPVAYANWIEETCQVRRDSTTVFVWLTDPTARDWIEQEYADLIAEALSSIGPFTVQYTDGAN